MLQRTPEWFAALIGVAALFLATGTAHATTRLPEAMLGNWCGIEGGDEQNWNQQIFARVPWRKL